MTSRERHLLQLVLDDMKHGRRWADRVLSAEPAPGQAERITWEEMSWLADFEAQGNDR
jgi:hypothetical protein